MNFLTSYKVMVIKINPKGALGVLLEPATVLPYGGLGGGLEYNRSNLQLKI